MQDEGKQNAVPTAVSEDVPSIDMDAQPSSNTQNGRKRRREFDGKQHGGERGGVNGTLEHKRHKKGDMGRAEYL